MELVLVVGAGHDICYGRVQNQTTDNYLVQDVVALVAVEDEIQLADVLEGPI